MKSDFDVIGKIFFFFFLAWSTLSSSSQHNPISVQRQGWPGLPIY